MKRFVAVLAVATQMMLCCAPTFSQPKSQAYDVDFLLTGASPFTFGKITGLSTGGSLSLYGPTNSTASVYLEGSDTNPIIELYVGSNRRFTVSGATGGMRLGGTGLAADPFIAFDTSGVDGAFEWNRAYDAFLFYDKIFMNSTTQIALGSANRYIYGTATGIRLNVGAASTVGITGGLGLTSNGYIKCGTVFASSDSSAGLTTTVTVDSGGGTCTMTFKGGILTAETCP